MPNLLTRGSSWLTDRLHLAAGVKVTYRRGNESVTQLTAVPGQVRHDDYGDGEAQLTTRDRDWLIWVSDLKVAGEFWAPKRGDEIDWVDSTGTKRTFRVLPRAGDRCYRHTDQTLQQYRVFTVEIVPNSE